MGLWQPIIVALLAVAAGEPVAADAGGPETAVTAAQIEADWLLQQRLRRVGRGGRKIAARDVIRRGSKLADQLTTLGVDIQPHRARLAAIQRRLDDLPVDASAEDRNRVLLDAHWAVRRLALANPLLNFDDLLLVKRSPGRYSHMCDQYFGWWSRPGGGIYRLCDFKGPRPTLRCLTEDFPPGSFLRPDLSSDGRTLLFAYCRFEPGVAELADKVDKSQIPEHAFYHLWQMDLETGRSKRLTHGRYDDFDGRFLPDGRIVFLSTRRGQQTHYDERAAERYASDTPDGFMRCGGGPQRPVAVYTLHVMQADGTRIAPISPFENFEWNPTVAADGRILYTRWDYVDRDNLPFMSLWSTLPDGSSARAVYGNFTASPISVFETRCVPNSSKLLFTASANHSITGGSLVLLDPRRGHDGTPPLKRLTPDVPFPESEGWPTHYYASPFPLSDDHLLTAWSHRPLAPEGEENPADGAGIYLLDAFGNQNLLYRDESISSFDPLPIRPRTVAPSVAASATDGDPAFGRMIVQDVYRGLEGVERGTIKRLRLVGVPPKTQPTMNFPAIGITGDDPGKFVLGTVPVEDDGSAYFHVPAGVSLLFQTLDADGVAVQTMRSVAYVQGGQTYACVGCHEHRATAPIAETGDLAALRRGPSRLRPGPDGSWPIEFDALVQPVLNRHCVSCHRPAGEHPTLNLTRGSAYDALIAAGPRDTLWAHVLRRYDEGRSVAGRCAAQSSYLWRLLCDDHFDVQLSDDDRERLLTWMDTYAQRAGSFSDQQRERLEQLRKRLKPILMQREATPPPPSTRPVSWQSKPNAQELTDEQLLATAGERIERHRKADAVIEVIDAAGRPIPGVQVRIEQTRHAFLFGCNIFKWGNVGDEQLEAAYRQRFADLLNFATIGYYWWSYERRQGQPRHEYAEQVARWCGEQGIVAKGHPLAWNYADAGWMPDDPRDLFFLQQVRIDDCVERFAGLIDVWDVVNEPTHFDRESFLKRSPKQTKMWQQAGQIEFTRQCFDTARRANRDATLLINDYRTDEPYAEVIKQLTDDDGQRLYDVIGIQSHMHGGTWNNRKIWDVCQRFAQFDVPLHFTETTVVSGQRGWGLAEKGVDWRTTPEGEAFQAREVERFYTMLFSHSAVEAITWWDFSDRGAWQRAPAGLLRNDMTPKPAYDALHKLIKKQWWTDQTATTTETGRAEFRAFLGEHRITLTAPNRPPETKPLTLRRAGPNRLVVVLP